jgi:predicted DNA-binding transcriptional regulator AlpA
MPNIEALRLLTKSDLKRLWISYSNVHMLRLEEMGKMPKRIYLSPGRIAWVESEILDYVSRCIAARG